MVKVRLYPNLLCRSGEVDQFLVVELLGESYRHLCADADDIDMLNGFQAIEEEPKFGRGERQGVPPRDNNIADLPMFADIVDHPLVIFADGIPAAADHGFP